MVQQLEMGGMATNETIAIIHARRQKKAAKESPEDVFDRDCRAYNLPRYVRKFPLVKSDQSERKGHKVLTWYFDFCFIDYKLIVEVDGGIWTRGAHGHPIDIVRNMKKQNDAVAADLWVLRYSTTEVTSSRKIALAAVMRELVRRGWKQPE